MGEIQMIDTKNYIIDKYKLNIPKKGKRIDIPNIGRNDLATIFDELDMIMGAEIGTEKGKYAQVLLERIPELRLFCIDPWEEHLRGIGYLDVGQNYHNKNYFEAYKRVYGYDCFLIRDYSANAVKLFPDNSLDFVYIDGNHRIDFVMQDLVLWTAKVKSGGIIAGHDYIKHKTGVQNHVPYALHAFIEAFRYKNFFVLDKKSNKRTKEQNRGRDRIRSWFFVKDDKE